MRARGIEEEGQFVLYLHSFYFTTTTILTVGYGDIVPTNTAEIAVVVTVQIMGTPRLSRAS